MASASDDFTVIVWKVYSWIGIKYILKKASNKVYCVAFSPDGEYLASAGRDNVIHIWRVSNREFIKTFSGHNQSIRSVEFSLNGQFVVSRSLDRTIGVWRFPSGERLKTLRDHKDDIWSVAFSPNGEYLMSGSRGGTIGVWKF